MQTFRFINARFPDPSFSKDRITDRLRAHRRSLLAVKKEWERPLKADGTPDEDGWRDLLENIHLTPRDRSKIERRAEAISQCHAEATGLSHLRKEDAKKLEVLRQGVRLAQVTSEHHADELAAALHAEFPWMAPATEAVWHAMRRSVRSGDPGLRLPPMLLDGPPGIGKSAWARALGNLINTPTMVYEATNESASFGLVGSQRSWGNSNPGRLITAILAHRVGNPVVVVDEVEKSGRAESAKGHAYSLTDALLPLLEPLSAANWSCPYFEVAFDMSYVIWVMTSNNHRRLPEPLLSRCPPIRLRALSTADLTAFALCHGRRKGLSGLSVEVLVDTLQQTGKTADVSVRTVLRMLEKAAALEQQDRRLH